MANDNGDKRFQRIRSYLLLAGGLLGFFVYLVLTTVFEETFHDVFIIGFLAMMGLGITTGIDKK